MYYCMYAKIYLSQYDPNQYNNLDMSKNKNSTIIFCKGSDFIKKIQQRFFHALMLGVKGLGNFLFFMILDFVCLFKYYVSNTNIIQLKSLEVES